MQRKVFNLGDIVEMKKPHPCGTNAWKVIRMGMDIRMKCTGCGHSVLLPRSRFEKRMKRVLIPAESNGDENSRPGSL
ncbi:hypothetical protein SAMN04488025_10530 [Planifilum fulgidum]|uniref:DUF951 domain-containing protein n=1 Tax=Planifilum fulgidum TaxID=201973 RepID=A0A1I2LID1_9BACL|nr:DUF951 domain-containing protein [Planifilum fulgidum]MBO2496408.1 DUF951 domain-containing protein [Bacillota bacterium]MBO2531302.1 DUF951 domain-containing protein [Thermoactinomycetaceae bacterium]SFF78209.1 hypothetical protein SAMN04488025_10530 [Planifilum fulgidum]